MTNPVQILDAKGRPLPPSRGAMALAGGSNTPLDAASRTDQHMAEWWPWLMAKDSGYNPYRDIVVARTRDLVANDGWASGAVTRLLDNAIGASFRPVSKPDHRALARMTGIKAFDAVWAREYGQAVDAYYRTWADDPGRYCDATRTQTVTQMMFLGFRHKMVDGDALAQMMWLPERVGYGRARYATAVMMLDPDRLSNPQLRFDMRDCRGGVRINERTGEAVSYWIRQAHQTDWFMADKAVTWSEIPRETAWGRPIIVHDFDREQSAQHRGIGILAPVIRRLKALIKYDGAELDAALLNAIFSAYIESPFDHEMVEDALGDKLPAYQAGRLDFHKEKRLSLGGARIPVLFPGEKISAVNAARPVSNFDGFEYAMLRNVAQAAGLSQHQVTGDWSKGNYSSDRAAALEAWKTIDRRRDNFAIGFAAQLRCAWQEEAHDLDDLPLPAGAPDFAEARGSYGRALWMGPGRGYVDVLKEREGAVVGMGAALTTLEQQAAEQNQDWEDNLDQLAQEKQGFESRGLDLPEWLSPAAAQKQEGANHDPSSPNYTSDK